MRKGARYFLHNFFRPRIWSMEYNGSGRGCGLVAADDKIHVWRDV